MGCIVFWQSTTQNNKRSSSRTGPSQLSAIPGQELVHQKPGAARSSRNSQRDLPKQMTTKGIAMLPWCHKGYLSRPSHELHAGDVELQSRFAIVSRTVYSPSKSMCSMPKKASCVPRECHDKAGFQHVSTSCRHARATVLTWTA